MSTTTSPTLFITSTSTQKNAMTEGFFDRLTYKLLFKPLDLRSFHNISSYIVRKVLCEPYIFLNCNNFIYLNHQVANQSVGEILRKMSANILHANQSENCLENNKMMKTLRIAVRDSRNLGKMSKYDDGQNSITAQNKKDSQNLWYFVR